MSYNKYTYKAHSHIISQDFTGYPIDIDVDCIEIIVNALDEENALIMTKNLMKREKYQLIKVEVIQ